MRLVDDGHGNFVFPGYKPRKPEDGFEKLNENFDSTMRWAVAGSVISGIVITVAIVAIVYAIIDCLKKAGNALPEYTRIATGNHDGGSSPRPSISKVSERSEAVMPVLADSEVEFATMERFLSDIGRERPIRFSPDQLSRFTNNYSTKLGSGGFGVVYKGEFPNGVPIAVKVLNSYANKQVEEQFMAEVSTMGRTYHINLVRLYGFCFHSTTKALVYEFAENGSLDRFLFGESQAIEWEKLHEIAIGTAKGISYLHEECQKRIVHYDIKPGNVLLDGNWNPKIADFGLAKLFNRGSSHAVLPGFRGTLGYGAPELFKCEAINYKCDVYSFGMLLFEILARRRNFRDDFTESRQWLPKWTWEMYNKNELGEMLPLCGIQETSRENAERVAKVALLCVQYSPDDRPLMSNVVKMLEGTMEISPPPNPFQYLESFQPNSPLQSGSNHDMSDSTMSTSEHSSGNADYRALEIDLAN